MVLGLGALSPLLPFPPLLPIFFLTETLGGNRYSLTILLFIGWVDRFSLYMYIFVVFCFVVVVVVVVCYIFVTSCPSAGVLSGVEAGTQWLVGRGGTESWQEEKHGLVPWQPCGTPPTATYFPLLHVLV